jgi:hypothetical protein
VSESAYELVHANVAHMRAPLDAPMMNGFVSQIDEINALARSAPGFVGQPALPDEGTVYRAPRLLNISIWRSVESLDAFTHQGQHALALDRRAEWFESSGDPTYVLFWMRRGCVPTEREIHQRLDHLARHGPTPYAFTFGERFTPAEAVDIARMTAEPE